MFIFMCVFDKINRQVCFAHVLLFCVRIIPNICAVLINFSKLDSGSTLLYILVRPDAYLHVKFFNNRR